MSILEQKQKIKLSKCTKKGKIIAADVAQPMEILDGKRILKIEISTEVSK